LIFAPAPVRYLWPGCSVDHGCDSQHFGFHWM